MARTIFCSLGLEIVYSLRKVYFGAFDNYRNNRLTFTFFLITGVCKTEEDEGPITEEDSQSFHGLGVCKWFNVRMGFGFLSMTSQEGDTLEAPVDVFVHQVS